MSNSDHILVFMSARDCGACIELRKNGWAKIKKEIGEIKGVRLHEIDLENKKHPLPPKLPLLDSAGRAILDPVEKKPIFENFPGDFKRFRRWYPMFCFFTAQSWKEGKRLEGVVFNGRMEGESPVS